MSQPTIASVERELVECQQECGRLIGQLRKARAQAYEEIAEEAEKNSVSSEKFGSKSIALYNFAIWLRSESKRIRESK